MIYRYYTSFRDNAKRLHTTKKIEIFLKFRPEQDAIDLFEKYLTDFWTLFSETFVGMKEYLASTEDNPAAKFRNRESGGLLYFRPVALPQLVIAILETCFRSKIPLSDSMVAYSKLEMCISKAPWVKVLWDSDKHTMIMPNKTLVHLLLMFMYDSNILNKKELDGLKTRYAKALEVELSEIDGILSTLLLL